MVKARNLFVGLAALFAILLPFYFAYAALGVRFGLHDWKFGLVTLTRDWGTMFLKIGAGAGVLALLASLLIKPRNTWRLALVALIIPLAGIGYGLKVQATAKSLPFIHDITTNFADPPGFSDAVVAARGDQSNSLDLLSKTTDDGARFIDAQRQGYPDIAPVITQASPDAAFDAALELAKAQNWTIGLTDRQAGRIEAMAQTFWFGFKDDIAIRIRAESDGTHVDMRSVSRVGKSDIGANAARMRPFLAALREKLDASK